MSREDLNLYQIDVNGNGFVWNNDQALVFVLHLDHIRMFLFLEGLQLQ